MTTRFRTLRLALAGTGLGLFLAVTAAMPMAFAADQPKPEGARPEVAKPLQEVQEALKQKNWAAALAKLNEADAVKDKTPYETYIINRMRGVAAAGSGDSATAIKALVASYDSGKVPPEEMPAVTGMLETLYSQTKDYPNAAIWAKHYIDGKGPDPKMKERLAQDEYLAGDYAGVVRDLPPLLAAAEAGGQKPSEIELKMLGSAYVKQNNDAAYMPVLEKLVTLYPSKDYWADLISHVAHKPGFSQDLFIVINRLQHETGSLTNWTDFVELDLQEGVNSEAKAIADEGAAKGLVSKATQAKADAAAAKDRATLDRDAKEAANYKDGNVLASIGYSYVGFGDVPKGIAALDQAIAKGGLKHPAEVKLNLGIAYFKAGQAAKAIDAFNAVPATGGANDLARLWVLRVKQGA